MNSIQLTVTVHQQPWRVDLSAPFDLAIPLDFSGPQPSAFGLPPARAEAFAAGNFVGDLRQGGPVNCFTVITTPHGNGTHTETARHIHANAPTLAEINIPALLPAWVATVPLTLSGDVQDQYPMTAPPDEWIISRQSLIQATANIPAGFWQALVLRTTPNTPHKQQQIYSGQNPAYFSLDAMEWIVQHDVEHLLVDLPSVDREEDQGKLAAHHLYWHQAWHRTITEMVYVSEQIPDGPYFLNLQVPRFALDAAPSRPLLLPATPV